MSASLFEITVKTVDGTPLSLRDYAGQVLLIVNVASYCGYTPQYQALQTLQESYGDRGFRVLGFPCNDFGAQEPGSNNEIKQFCITRYRVSFDLFEKISLNGANRHPLYSFLIQAATPPGAVAWNFEKFLIDRQGQVIARFSSAVPPDSGQVVGAIEQALGAPPNP